MSVESAFAGVCALLARLLVFISTIHDDFSLPRVGRKARLPIPVLMMASMLLPPSPCSDDIRSRDSFLGRGLGLCFRLPVDLVLGDGCVSNIPFQLHHSSLEHQNALLCDVSPSDSVGELLSQILVVVP